MTTHRTEAAPGGTAPAAPGARSWWRGRSEIFVGLLTVAIGVFLAVQTGAMHVPDNSASPGPRLFPSLVSALMIVLGAVLVLQVVRRPAPEPDGGEADRPEGAGVVGALVEGERPHTAAPAAHSDWRTVGTVLGSVVLFALLLQPVGWLLSGALLFFGVAWAFGGRRPLFEATVALVYSSVVQLAFVAGLGLNLPSGILGGVL